jgi:hypothetical protein
MAMRRQFSEMTGRQAEAGDDDGEEADDGDELDHALGEGDEDAHDGHVR